jgi:hypothetical protein
MIPFDGYQVYKVERQYSESERRQADIRAGEAAATFAEFLRSLAQPARAMLERFRAGRTRSEITEINRPATREAGGRPRAARSWKAPGPGQAGRMGELRLCPPPVDGLGTSSRNAW